MRETQDTSLTLGACFSSVGMELESELRKAGLAPELPVDIVSRHSVARAVSRVVARQKYVKLGELLPGLELTPHAELPLVDLSVRAHNILKNTRIRTVGQLGEWSVGELWDIDYCGVKSVHEICSMATRIHLENLEADLARESRKGEDYKGDELAHVPGGEVRLKARATELRYAQLRDSLGVVALWAVEILGAKKLMDFLILREGIGPMPEDVRDALAAFLSTELSALTEEPSNEWVVLLLDVLLEMELRERRVFEERELGKRGKTLDELGEEFDVTRQRIRQIQTSVVRKVRRAVAQPKLAPFRWRLFALEFIVGAGAPKGSPVLKSAVGKALLNLDESIVSPEFILWAAGPYRLRAGWWLKDKSKIPRIDSESVLFTDGPAISEEAVGAWLERQGFNAQLAVTVLQESKAIRRFGDRWFRWSGSVVDKAEVILTVLGEPADSTEIADKIGEGHNATATRNRLFEDDRFVRVNKREFALVSWGLEEYSGIAQEIKERIEREGGSASLSAVTEELARMFEVAEASVRAYAEAPMFVIEDGLVRLRTSAEPYAVDERVHLVPGLFPEPDGKRVHLVYTVTSESLRGSGTSIKEPIAAALGCSPGSQASFEVESDKALSVRWSEASATGPSLGSVRSLVDFAGARKGEKIRITFDLEKLTATATKIAADAPDLPELTGLTFESGRELDTLAESLKCADSAVRGVLRVRGDGRVADALPEEPPDPKLERALESLGTVLDRD